MDNVRMAGEQEHFRSSPSRRDSIGLREHPLDHFESLHIVFAQHNRRIAQQRISRLNRGPFVREPVLLPIGPVPDHTEDSDRRGEDDQVHVAIRPHWVLGSITNGFSSGKFDSTPFYSKIRGRLEGS